MRKPAQITGIVVLFLLLSTCSSYDKTARIADVRKEEVLVLKHTHESSQVHGISIRVTGDIDGEAVICLILNGEPYKTEMLKGKVHFEWGGDWYSDTAEIRYKPNNINSGELVIEYKFSVL